MKEIPNIQEQLLANKLICGSAEKASSTLDSFSSWLLAGYGASAVLLVSQYESVAKLFTPVDIHNYLVIFFYVLAVAAPQKFISAVISAQTHSYGMGNEVGKRAFEESAPNFEGALAEMGKTYLPGTRWWFRIALRRMNKGDIVLRLIPWLQFQALLCLAQAILTLLAITTIACSFGR